MANNIDTNGDLTQVRREINSPITTRVRRNLGKSGTVQEPPKNESTNHAADDDYSFLAAGRDFEPLNTTHKYTAQEKVTLASYESHDYLPSHSTIYKNWVKKQTNSSYQFDVWAMMGLIGFTIGLIGFVLHQLIEKIADVKWEVTQKYIEDDNFAVACLFATGYSVIFILCSAGIVIYLRPCAGGSGIPEVTGFLSGTNVRHIFNIKTMVVKFLSCVTCVGCGFPVGPEGPMIHLGALVGAGLSQFKSETLKVKLPFLEKFRTSESRRNFISAGAAAGVASAFGAPVGGLLFSMEEVSSFWTVTLSWQIFFCCIVATFTTDLFNSAFMDFEYTGNFGEFKTNRYILFQIDQGVDVNLVMFLPTMIIGVLGGLLGALFTIINLKITRARKYLLSRIKKEWLQKLLQLFEPSFIMVIVTIFSILIPAAFSCTEFSCMKGDSGNVTFNCLNDTKNPLHVDPYVVRYTCPEGKVWSDNKTTVYTNGTYNEVASLLFGTLENAVTFLFSRNTHHEFNYPSLLTALPFYFIAVSWACSTAVACGAGTHVMELTNDVQVLLPVMVGVMVAKWVADFFTHPIYHALLELKCIPFLDMEPRVTIDKKDHPDAKGRKLDLELYTARDIMTRPVLTVQTYESIARLADLLVNTLHGGFPVIKKGSDGKEHFYGVVTRMELTVILMNEDLFEPEGEIVSESDEEEIKDPSWIEFPRVVCSKVVKCRYCLLNIHKLDKPIETTERLHKYIDDPRYKNLALNLKPYTNQSALAVQEKFSLKRTYVIFRTLGLRHLTVTDDNNTVKGIITRKDLMGFSLQERLSEKRFEI